MSYIPRILFIDDESLICTMAEDFLKLRGLTVETFEDSSEALAVFSVDPAHFDIVVADQTMPGISGLELLRKIRTIRGDIPEILCTRFGDMPENLNKFEEGIDAFFMKPYSFDELVGQIHKLV